MSAHFLVFWCVQKAGLGNPSQRFYSTFPFLLLVPVFPTCRKLYPRGRILRKRALHPSWSSHSFVQNPREPHTCRVACCCDRNEKKTPPLSPTVTPSLPVPRLLCSGNTEDLNPRAQGRRRLPCYRAVLPCLCLPVVRCLPSTFTAFKASHTLCTTLCIFDSQAITCLIIPSACSCPWKPNIKSSCILQNRENNHDLHIHVTFVYFIAAMWNCSVCDRLNEKKNYYPIRPMLPHLISLQKKVQE